MQKLKQFLRFDWEKFAKEKSLMYLRKKPWTDANRNQLGTKYEVVITEDGTDYGEAGAELNLGEKIAIKTKRDIDIPPRALVVPLNVMATVYGDYSNQLSVVADDIQVVGPNQGGPNPKKEN